jgi:GntR family transcriptional regulator/MocR family aminotransferase
MGEPIDVESLFPDRGSGETLGAQLTRRLRHAIETGFFAPGARLLPSRELARRLGVARNTVTAALDQLIAEGYLEARVGAGTYVTTTFTTPRPRAATTKRPLPPHANTLAAIKAELDVLGTTAGPLRIGAPDLAEFPLRAWQQLSRKHLTSSGAQLDYGQSSGLLALRQAISRHIAQFRGVAAESEQIIIVEGAQAAFALIAQVLTAPGDRVAIEDPCYPLARAAFTSHGLAVQAIPVDDDGIRTDALPLDATFAYLTPSHQFPLGGALPLGRRLALLRWARRTDTYLVEDDYDSEFDAHPLPALQSLDRDERVIYVGTFSKTLAPGLRLGYIVVPPHLAQTFRLARALASLGSAAALQATLADFIAQGHFARHIHRMTAIYERRRHIVVETLAAGLPDGFRVGPAQTGLHVAVTGPPTLDDVAMLDAVPPDQRSLPLSRLCVERTDCRGVVVGYGAAGDEAVAHAAQQLAATLRQAVRLPMSRGR